MRSRFCTITATFAVLSLAPVHVLAQEANDQLPWLHSSASQQSQTASPQTSQSSHGHGSSKHHKSAPAAAPTMQNSADEPGRDADDRKLNSLAQEYYHISSKDSHAVDTITKLEKRVKSFHAELTHRSYDVADLVKDTTSLERRIASKKKKLSDAAARTVNN